MVRRVAGGAGVVLLFLAPSPAVAQRTLLVVGRDTALEAPPSVGAGLVAVRFQNDGKVRRELVVRRIPAGRTPEEILSGPSGKPPALFAEWSFGGPALGDSAADGTVTMELRPGRYVLVAYEVDGAGRPRADGLMWRAVSAMRTSVLISGRFPTPDVRARIKDSGLEITGLFQRGARTFNVRNASAHAHEFRVGRLRPGKTVDDVRRWSPAGNSERPFVQVGGTTPLSPSREAQTRLVLQPGDYVILCTLRHGRDGKPHHQTGMLEWFRVS